VECGRRGGGNGNRGAGWKVSKVGEGQDGGRGGKRVGRGWEGNKCGGKRGKWG